MNTDRIRTLAQRLLAAGTALTAGVAGDPATGAPLVAAGDVNAAAWQDCMPADAAEAYAVQDLVIAAHGEIGGWKVGARSPDHPPTFAPLPAARMYTQADPVLAATVFRTRGIEVEVAFRVAQDLTDPAQWQDAARVLRSFDAVFPALEIVETRLQQWPDCPPLVQLADLQSHGATVLAASAPAAGAITPQRVALRDLGASLSMDGRCITSRQGGHPHGDAGLLLCRLAAHAAARGRPLRAGQLVLTGSCTGLHFAPPRSTVRGRIDGLGEVGVRFIAG